MTSVAPGSKRPVVLVGCTGGGRKPLVFWKRDDRLGGTGSTTCAVLESRIEMCLTIGKHFLLDVCRSRASPMSLYIVGTIPDGRGWRPPPAIDCCVSFVTTAYTGFRPAAKSCSPRVRTAAGRGAVLGPWWMTKASTTVTRLLSSCPIRPGWSATTATRGSWCPSAG